MLPYIFLVLLVAIWVLYRRTYSRFRRAGVRHRPPFPLVGNLGSSITNRQNPFSRLIELFSKFPGERFVGQYHFSTPVVYLKDLDLIRRVAVDNFDCFTDRQPILKDYIDPVFGRMLFSLQGQEWMDMRMTLAPAFTSCQAEEMFQFVVKTALHVVDWLKQRIKESKTNYIDVDVKDMCHRYVIDVVAASVFDQNVNSLAQRNNSFYQHTRRISKFSVLQLLKFIGFTSIPRIMEKLEISFLAEKTKRYFKNLLLTNMNNRLKLNFYRPDLINILLEIKRNQLSKDKMAEGEANASFVKVEGSLCQRNFQRVWSDEDLTAQAFLFLLTGLDSTTCCLKFLLYELATNPHVQRRLVREIKEHVIDEKFDYSAIDKMSYLDMVVSESLRLWPPTLTFNRLCVKDFDLGKPNSKAPNYIVKAGETVTIPAGAIHRDPIYFPNPNTFDPERFSEKNKQSIHPYSYMPFGIGPRNCIGSRLAMCQVKVLVILILLHMELLPCKKTPVPARLAPTHTSLEIKGGHWIRFELRTYVA